MTKNNLIEIFNQACIVFAAFMDKNIEQEFPAGEIIVTEAFPKTKMDDIDDTWWDEKNVANQIDFFNSLSQQNQMKHTEVGYQFLNNHKERFEKERQRAVAFKYVQHLFPHMVGAGSSQYGLDLRKTNGFETLKEVCDTLSNVKLSNWLVPHPEAKTLESAFMLAVHMQAVDGEPLRNKVERARDGGLFARVRDHYDLS